MATSCMIGYLDEDNIVKMAYCHYDGYPVGGVGSTLAEHYNDFETIKALVNIRGFRELYNTVESTNTCSLNENLSNCWKIPAVNFIDEINNADWDNISYFYIFDPNYREWTVYACQCDEAFSMFSLRSRLGYNI